MIFLHHRISFLAVCCIFLHFLTVTCGSLLRPELDETNARRIALEDATKTLASIGVTGLCHPTTDRFAPHFRKCADRRKLENNDEDDNNDDVDDNTDDDDVDDNLQYGGYEKDDAEYNYAEYNNIEEDEDGVFETTWFYLFNSTLTVICVIVGSLSSGLYIGLLSLDPLLLVIKSRTSKSEKEKRRIQQLLALIKQRHQLVVTLLIISCLAAEAMPVFLQRFVHDYLAILVSVILVLFFGEILPTILFTGMNQIEMASRWAPVVRLSMCLLYPVAYPIAHLLELLSSGGGGNCCAGDSLSSGDDHHGAGIGGTLYNRGELAALIRVQYEQRRAMRQRRKDMKMQSMSSLNQGHFDLSEMSIHSSPTSSIDLRNFKREFHKQASMASIDSHDVNMIEGALQLKLKSAIDVHLSFHKVFCIPHDMVLDETNIFTIYASGYSRVPVYVNGDRRQVRGILLTRHLMVVNNKTEGGKRPTPLDLSLHTPRCVPPDENLSDLINLFQSGTSAVQAGHMALVCARPEVGNKALERGEAIPEKAGLMGICTLEDVLEALLQQQIYDEMDAGERTAARTPPQPVDGMATIQENGSYHPLA